MDSRSMMQEAELSQLWDSSGKGKNLQILNTKFKRCHDGIPDEEGITVVLRVSPRPLGIVVVSVGVTEWNSEEFELDLATMATVWLPGDSCSMFARIDAPFPDASPSENPEKVKIYTQAYRGRKGGIGTQRRTITATDPVSADPSANVYIPVPFSARRFNVFTTGTFANFGSPGTSTVGRIEGLDANGNLVCRWETDVYSNIMALGILGVEIPSNVQQLALIGNGQAPVPNVFSTFVFQLGV